MSADDAAPDGARPLRGRRTGWIAAAFAAISFLLYASAVLILAPGQQDKFFQERSSLASAVSHVYYHAPFGTVYSGILARLLDININVPSGGDADAHRSLGADLAQASRHDVAPGILLGSTSDGNGIGYMTIAGWSLRLFGPHVRSLVLGMLTVMGISAVAFGWRYRDRYVLVVVLYFTSLTIMLFTPLVWEPFYTNQIAIGGIRYFSLVAILPAFHLILEFADGRETSFSSSRGAFVPTGMQVVILLLAILVRNSAEFVLAAIALACLLAAWTARRAGAPVARILLKAGYLAAVGAVFAGVLLLSVSKSYLTEGRFTETVWHRIFVSLGLNPEWPFGNLHQEYGDCTKYIPDGLTRGPEDRNGHCILWDYAIKHHIPVDTVPTLTYGRTYDKVLRQAFFHILREYPWQVLWTFIYIKPSYVLWSIWASLPLTLVGIPSSLIWILSASLANLIPFSLIVPPSAGGNRRIAKSALLLALFSLPPLLAVWAMPHTSADLLFYCLFGAALAASAALQGLRRWTPVPTAGQLPRAE